MIQQGAHAVGSHLPAEVMAQLVNTIVEKDPGSPRAYAFVTGRNEAVKRFRATIRAERLPAILAAKAAAEATKRLEEAQQLELARRARANLKAAMATLPSTCHWTTQRLMLAGVTALFEGWTFEEVASVFNVRPNTVHQWKRRILTRCRNRLAPDEFELLAKWGCKPNLRAP